MPGSLEAVHDWREAVHGDQGRHDAGALTALNNAADRGVIRLEQCRHAPRARGRGEAAIAGHEDAVALLGDRSGVAELAVAIDDQARIAAEQRRRIESFGQTTRHVADTDIPGDV